MKRGPVAHLISQFELFPTRHRWKSVALSLIIVSTCPGLLGQEPNERQRNIDRASATETTNEYISTLRPHLFGNMSTSELTIYNTITFRVTNLEATWKAASGKEDGERYVEIDEGVARQMEILAAALIIEEAQHRDVLIPYLRYVAMAQNRNVGFIKDVTVFAHFDPDEIDGNPARHRQQIAMVLNGMAFLLAHEVGHHVLGHYDRPWPTDLSARRQLELDADAWAIKRCLNARPHFSPIGGLLPLLYSYYTTPHPIAREASADHPAEVRRILGMFQAMQSSLPDFRDEIIQQGASYSDFKEYINRTVANYTRELEEDRTPVEELSSLNKKTRSDETMADDDDDDDTPRRKPKPHGGDFCGDVYGRRYCQMVQPQPLGSACTCSNLPGWGVVVP